MPDTFLPERHKFVPKTNAASPRNIKVVALAYDGLCTFEYGIVAEIFGLKRPDIGPFWYDFKTVTLESGPLRAAGGLKFSANGKLSDLRRADIILIPGWRGVKSSVPDILCTELRKAHARGAQIVSICSGIFVLAAAGLLAGRTATTHWRYTEALGDQYPDIHIKPNVLYVDDGDILTSAGSSAGIDLCLHIVRRDFGVKIANRVARRLVAPAHRQGGQAQFIEQPVPREYEGHRLSPVLDYIRSHLQHPLDISALAKNTGMSTRTFHRRFIALTGLAPFKWINAERLARARTLIETTHASLDEIAQSVGFKDSATLRYHFGKNLSVSPSHFRKNFEGETP